VILFAAGFVFIGFYVDSISGSHLRYLGAGLLTACAAFAVGCLVGLVVGIPRFVSSGAMRHDMEARRATTRLVATPPVGEAVSVAVTAPGKAEHRSQPRTQGTAADGHDQQTAAQAIAAQLGPALADAPGPVSSGQLSPSTNLAEISDWLTKLLLGAGLVELTRLGRPLSGLVDAVARGMRDLPPGVKPPESSVVVAAGILAMYVVLGFLDGYILTTVWYGKYLERLDYT
jgi:hypothetical protein